MQNEISELTTQTTPSQGRLEVQEIDRLAK